MRKLIISEHISLDGFAAGPNREMDWIKLDGELFDTVGELTDNADTALYGRVTWEMMDEYWPNAGNEANSSKHDKEHSAWYNSVDKIVLSRSMKNVQKNKTRFIAENVFDEIKDLKKSYGKNILIFGSPGVGRQLLEQFLIDEMYVFVNPVILGAGIPLFPEMKNRINLKAQSTKSYKCGATMIHFECRNKTLDFRL